MTGLVVDASVAVEYLFPTQLGDRVAGLIEGTDLVVPEILDAEVLSVLRRWVLHGRINTPEAEVVLDRLVHWPVIRIPNRDLVQGAWRYRNNVSAYDALYVALANTRDFTLLTTDARLSRAPGLGVMVQHVHLS